MRAVWTAWLPPIPDLRTKEEQGHLHGVTSVLSDKELLSPASDNWPVFGQSARWSKGAGSQRQVPYVCDIE